MNRSWSSARSRAGTAASLGPGMRAAEPTRRWLKHVWEHEPLQREPLRLPRGEPALGPSPRGPAAALPRRGVVGAAGARPHGLRVWRSTASVVTAGGTRKTACPFRASRWGRPHPLPAPGFAADVQNPRSRCSADLGSDFLTVCLRDNQWRQKPDRLCQDSYDSCSGNLPYYATYSIVLSSLTLFNTLIDMKVWVFMLWEEVILQLRHVKCLLNLNVSIE